MDTFEHLNQLMTLIVIVLASIVVLETAVIIGFGFMLNDALTARQQMDAERKKTPHARN